MTKKEKKEYEKIVGLLKKSLGLMKDFNGIHSGRLDVMKMLNKKEKDGYSMMAKYMYKFVDENKKFINSLEEGE